MSRDRNLAAKPVWSTFLPSGQGSRVHAGSERPPPLSADQDGDKQLSLPEFISLPVGTVENRRGQDVDDSWVRDRRKEFEELIDANHDGIVTMAELEVCGCPGGRSWRPVDRPRPLNLHLCPWQWWGGHLQDGRGGLAVAAQWDLGLA